MNDVKASQSEGKAWDPYPTLEEAKQYDEISTVQQQWALSTLEQCDFLKDAINVLDVGCGTGIVTANLAGRVKKGSVIGLDVSESMVKVAKQSFGEKAQNVSFLVGDAMNLPLKDGICDAATAFNSLHWLTDPVQGLKEIHRVLMPKGKIVIVAPDTSPTSFPLSQKVGQAIGSVFGSVKWRERLVDVPRGERFTKEGLEGFLEEAGFKDIEVKVTQVETVFKNREQVESWIYSSFTLVKRLKEESHRWELAKEITTKWLEIFKPEEDGSIKLIGPKLQAIAQK